MTLSAMRLAFWTQLHRPRWRRTQTRRSYLPASNEYPCKTVGCVDHVRYIESIVIASGGKIGRPEQIRIYLTCPKEHENVYLINARGEIIG